MSENTDEIVTVHVHVDNISEMITRTEEVEAQHYSSQTFTLPPLGAAVPQQILQLDPQRKRAVIAVSGNGQVAICHSAAQAGSLQANIQQGADEGMLITSPAAFTAESTGPLWAVGFPSSGLMTVGVLAERRRSA